MNQKFSQLNRDYAKSMAWRDDAVLKRSRRIGLGSFLLGLLVIFALLAVFFVFKAPLLEHFHQKMDKRAVFQEKTKFLPKQHSKHKKEMLPSKQEYGFYTILPNVEVKSARQAEDFKQALKEDDL